MNSGTQTSPDAGLLCWWCPARLHCSRFPVFLVPEAVLLSASAMQAHLDSGEVTGLVLLVVLVLCVNMSNTWVDLSVFWCEREDEDVNFTAHWSFFWQQTEAIVRKSAAFRCVLLKFCPSPSWLHSVLLYRYEVISVWFFKADKLILVLPCHYICVTSNRTFIWMISSATALYMITFIEGS